MIRINLLPHREEKRWARRQQFYVLLGLTIVFAGIIWFVGFSFINNEISTQDERNQFLNGEIAGLKKEITEIEELKQKTEALLARKRVIELLQSNRTETVHLFNELAMQVPDGIYLSSLKQLGNKLTIAGYAQSNSRITMFMNAMDGTLILTKSRLVETKAENVANRRLNAFIIETLIKSEVPVAEGVGKKAAKKT